MLSLHCIGWCRLLDINQIPNHAFKAMETLFNVPARCLQGFQQLSVRRDTVQIKTRVAANLSDSERP